MRRMGTVLLLAAAPLLAQDADPFAPPPADAIGPDAAPGAVARYTETLARLAAAVKRNPADAAALGRAMDLLERFDRALPFKAKVKDGLKAPLDVKARGALRGLLGRLLVAEAESLGWVGIIVIGPGNNPAPAPNQRAKPLYEEAVGHLREAIRTHPQAVRARRDLATALEGLDGSANVGEITRLRNEANAIEMRGRRERPAPIDLNLAVTRLVAEAENLEQRETPDHGGALVLRKQALVLAFCTHTIPFEYEPALWGPVSLLAPRNLVDPYLTRTFLKKNGLIGNVRPQVYPAKPRQQVELVAGLGRDTGAAAAAALLAVLCRQTWETDLARAAVTSLKAGDHAAARQHLPRLLDTFLFGEQNTVPDHAQRLLVRLAVAMRIQAAAPVLAGHLARDDDLYCPRDLAAALGHLGGPEHADLLLGLATDPGADAYFRRQAVLALGRLAPARLGELPDEPLLELAAAAARYRAQPSDDLKGRILAGLWHEHDADEAARYCADLDLREAIPQLEQWRAEKRDHYAADVVARALEELLARERARD